METYFWIKLLHILSATVLLGTGGGTAYFMLRSYLSDDAQAFAVTTRHVVAADWILTTPAVFVQLLTGLWLAQHLGIAFTSTWFIVVIGLFLFVGACWLPVVWIQISIRDLIAAGQPRNRYKKLMTWWIALGVPAFAAVLVILYLMVFRVGVLDQAISLT